MLPDTQNQRWAQDTSKFGYQMLLKMGWKEGNGLGKNQQGEVTHVRVEKREESLGMGMEEDSAGNSAFVGQIQSFNEVLKALNSSKNKLIVKKSDSKEKVKKKGKRSKNKKDEEKKSDKAKRKRGSKDLEVKKVIKKVKTKKSKSNEKSSTTKHSVLRKTFHKQLKSKNVSSYSSTDLKAILGGI